ncbi:hypothetical protein [Clostridium beijerinckii]|nr:hypothetical protein [Clostridium beijerinckii]NRU52630.1 hypothetical protein [Clostridium beijerinckii]NYC68673.1 hypothetical protein [Clostridium beijerinckii]NYC91822.1 hypothetical protein [Clostridium beijerinckii]
MKLSTKISLILDVLVIICILITNDISYLKFIAIIGILNFMYEECKKQ